MNQTAGATNAYRRGSKGGKVRKSSPEKLLLEQHGCGHCAFNGSCVDAVFLFFRMLGYCAPVRFGDVVNDARGSL